MTPARGREAPVVEPQQPDAEEAVLSACLMLDGDALAAVRDMLTPADFFDVRYRILFAAMLEVADAGSRVDPLTLTACLERRKELTAAGGREVIGWLIDAVPTAAGALHHAQLVREASRARRMLAVLRDAEGALYGGSSCEAVDGTLDRALAAFRSGAQDGRVFDDKQVMAASALAYLDGDATGGTHYGFAPWDGAVLPALPGHFLLLGGASGSGKSTVARNVIRQWVHRSRRRVGWLSCEMSGEEQLVALACMETGLPIESFYRRTLTKPQRQAFEDALAFWRDCDRLVINEMGGVTPERALRIFRRWREQGYDHFVLDHLHRLDYGATKSGDDLRVPVAATAKALKTLAKDLECVVMALVQYSKMKPHEEPDDSKIREANNVLEEADAVFHVYRPLVAHERSAIDGRLMPLTQATGLRYFEHDAPRGSVLGHDAEFVYLKLGKQRRRLRDGLVRIPFNMPVALLYDTLRRAEQEAA